MVIKASPRRHERFFQLRHQAHHSFLVPHKVIDAEQLQADTTCAKGCGSAGGKAPCAGGKGSKQETQGSCTCGKQGNCMHVGSRAAPCLHLPRGGTPIHSSQLREGRGRRNERREGKRRRILEPVELDSW